MRGVVAIIIKMNNFSIAVFNMMNWTWTHTSQIDQIISNRCEIHHPDHHSVTIRCPPYANANTTRHRYCSPRICTILFLINVSFIYFSLLLTSVFFFFLVCLISVFISVATAIKAHCSSSLLYHCRHRKRRQFFATKAYNK